MPKISTARVFTREVKLAAVRRMLSGENVSALARELQLRRKLLYDWRAARPRLAAWSAAFTERPSMTMTALRDS
jgi:transposase-like protein